MRNTILTIIALLLCMAGVFGQKQKVAIYVPKGTSQNPKMPVYTKVLASELQIAISRSSQFDAVERTGKFLELLSKEQAYQRSGQVDDSKIVELGKQENVDYVLSVELTELDENSFYAIWKLINVKTAVVDDGDSEMATITNATTDLKALSQTLTARIAGDRVSGSGTPPASSTSVPTGRRNGDSYNPDGIELVWVEGTGSGIMAVQGFYIGKYEVTQAQWKAVMGNNPSNWKGDLLPVESVSWEDCQEFVRKLNAMTGKKYALPTEAQWEYAANGGSARNTYEYAGSNSVGEVAWYEGNSGSRTHNVGNLSPNAVGAYDMSGNVWEWCQDCYDSSCSYRVLRGGSWLDSASSCRVAYRLYISPGSRSYDSGFRVVLLP